MKSRILLLVTCTLLLLPSILATERPVRGWVKYADENGINGATVTVHVNNSGCYCDCPDVTTDSNGEWVENLNNLFYVENCTSPVKSVNDPCGSDWQDSSYIWADADDSSATPSTENGTTAKKTIQNSPLISGITYLDNITIDTEDPEIILLSPPDENVSANGNVVFEFRVYDDSNISNCSLIFDEVINETIFSVQTAETKNFTKNNMPDGIYNWSVNCTDIYNNENNSEQRILNVSKVGYLTAKLIIPITDISVVEDEIFEFTAEVSCKEGRCGDVNASLDPIREEPENEEGISFFSILNDLLTSVENSLTGLAAGALVPTTPTDPFWTNSSNPADKNNFSCLENMGLGDSCNVTWWVNASGNPGNKSEFFVYFNSTTYTYLNNETEHINITINTTVDNSPIVSLNNPADNYENESFSVNLTFNCSTTDDINLENISLYITDDNNLSFALNQTTNISGTSSTNTWTLELGDGNYTWNCYACDNSSQCSFASDNRSVAVNYSSASCTPITSTIEMGVIKINDSTLTLNYSNVGDTYNIYYSENASAIIHLDLNNINSQVNNVTGITTSSWNDTNLYGIKQRYYRISAVKCSIENLTNVTVGRYEVEVVNATGVPGTLVDLNLISLPLTPANDSINSVFTGASDQDVVYRYNLDSFNYESSQYFAGFGWFGAFDTVETEIGYAFKPVANDYNFSVVGYVPQGNLTITVKNATGIPSNKRDLNIIGWHNVEEKCNLSSFIIGASDGDVIYKYNISNQNYESTQYFVGFGWFGAFDCFQPELAYEFKPVAQEYNWSYQRGED